MGKCICICIYIYIYVYIYICIHVYIYIEYISSIASVMALHSYKWDYNEAASANWNCYGLKLCWLVDKSNRTTVMPTMKPG